MILENEDRVTIIIVSSAHLTVSCRQLAFNRGLLNESVSEGSKCFLVLHMNDV